MLVVISLGVKQVGKKKKTTTQTYQPPSHVESASRQAIGIGQRIGSQRYEEYGGDRVAGLSVNEQTGIDMARDRAGAADPYYKKAGEYADRGAQQFKDADMQDYMNPYIKGALDPVAREIGERGQREANALDARASSMDAFGGSRAALMQSENREKTLQGISDVYGKGYAMAYESATKLWGDERARDMQAAGRFQDLGTSITNANRTDISTLMATGATDRSIQQAMADFDYQQFVEDRDWDFRNLGGLIAALEGTKGSYGTTSTTTEKTSGGEFAQALGIAATLVGAFYGGPAGAAAGGSLFGGEENGEMVGGMLVA
jgi:hypothetical protein